MIIITKSQPLNKDNLQAASDGFNGHLHQLLDTGKASWLTVEERILMEASRCSTKIDGKTSVLFNPPASRPSSFGNYPRRCYIRDPPQGSSLEDQQRCLQKLANYMNRTEYKTYNETPNPTNVINEYQVPNIFNVTPPGILLRLDRYITNPYVSMWINAMYNNSTDFRNWAPLQKITADSFFTPPYSHIAKNDFGYNEVNEKYAAIMDEKEENHAPVYHA